MAWWHSKDASYYCCRALQYNCAFSISKGNNRIISLINRALSKTQWVYYVCFFQIILLSPRATTICNCWTIIFAWALCLSVGDIIRLSLIEIIISLLIHSERKRVRISVNAFIALLCLKFDYIISLNHMATRTKFYYYFSHVSYQQEITFSDNAFLNNEKEKWFIERLWYINEFDTID